MYPFYTPPEKRLPVVFRGYRFDMGEPICSTTIPHINSETNPPSPIINVVCKYLRQFLATSPGVATLLIYCNNAVCKYLRQFLGTSFGVATLPINCNNE